MVSTRIILTLLAVLLAPSACAELAEPEPDSTDMVYVGERFVAAADRFDQLRNDERAAWELASIAASASSSSSARARELASSFTSEPTARLADRLVAALSDQVADASAKRRLAAQLVDTAASARARAQATLDQAVSDLSRALEQAFAVAAEKP
ncbi:MAG: hypothetical protein AAFN41_00150, partial [Planctomycetota bacterium]